MLRPSPLAARDLAARPSSNLIGFDQFDEAAKFRLAVWLFTKTASLWARPIKYASMLSVTSQGVVSFATLLIMSCPYRLARCAISTR